MVYAVPLYHPLRLAQEIIMLDHLSEGRLDIGFGRGSADTDREAQLIARRAYPLWHKSFTHLGRTLGSTARHPRPDSWDELHQQGKGVAGTPDKVVDFCLEQMRISQCNYLVGQFAFGDQTIEELNTSIALFGQEVMPKLVHV
jgi:alkanesulfonate monooxygenase SsuD/methylene tetrahydromethanopterin reductase-like flavin-dependent oxidoreductase (luciferase family)